LPMTVPGCDMSVNQGVLTDAQWAQMGGSMGLRFAYLQSRLGNERDDPMFARYVAGARANTSMALGPYLFFVCLPDDPAHPGRSPEDQAQAFFTASAGLGCNRGDLPPAIDIEDPSPDKWATDGVSKSMVDDRTGRVAAKIASLFGVEPVIYTYPWWQAEAGMVTVARYRLWIASYQDVPVIPAPWTSCVMQQTAGGGKLRLPNGAPCDSDVVADEETFASLLVP
jgi:GH25 family lysozyme M1 (1,4-beta-N-acetylmuramidase)